MASATQTQEVPVQTLLKRLDTITVAPQEDFDGDAFFEGWSMGPDFKAHFSGRKEKTEGKPVEVNIDGLEVRSLDRPIIRSLGKLPKAALPNLATFAAVAATGRSFVGYLFDNDGIPWAVHCSQFGVCRIVEAVSVASPYEWYVGDEFASLANS